MPQATIYPTRAGLSLPRGEMLQATEVLCEGGLDLSQSVLEVNPSYAIALINYEPSQTGGYRRISGFAKFSTTVVPGQGQLLGTLVHPSGYVLAARQDASDATKYNIYKGVGTNWTQINPATTTQTGDTTLGNDTIVNLSVGTAALLPGQPVSGTGIPAGTRIRTIAGANSITLGDANAAAVNATATNAGVTLTFSNPLTYTVGMVLQSHLYNWIGVYKIAIVDGVNYAYTWDTTVMKIIYTSGAKANPSIVCEHKGYLFVSGYSSNYGAIACSAPNNEYDWTTLDGAAEIVVGDTITGLRPWRDELYTFGKSTVHKLAGNSTDIFSSTPFTLLDVTNKVGCSEGRTIREINGDLIFLAPDGLRTISGTANIGDTDIGTISRPVQSLASAINPITTPCHSVVIHKKTQYRLFYPTPANAEIQATGLMAGIRKFRNNSIDWEFGQLRGFKTACADSGYWTTDGNEYVVHGGYDGYVYRQESGTTFNGTAISDVYTTVPFELGDRGVRKVLQRITVYVTSESAAPTISLALKYDLNNINVVQPLPYSLTALGSTSPATYDTDGVTYDGGFIYDFTGIPYFRQNVQGSGFLVQLQFTSANSVPFVIQGFLIEYFPAARR